MLLKNDFISFKYTENNILYITVEDDIIPSNNDFTEFIEWMNDLFVNKIKNKFCMVINIDNLVMLPYSKLNLFIELLNKINHIIQNNLIATSVICSSSIAKILLNMFFSLYEPKRPCKIFNINEDYSNFLINEYYKYMSNQDIL